MQTFDIPVCPITQEPMKDPVVDKEGNSYEKLAILSWLETNSISPLTRNPLFSRDLSPNRALIEITEILEKELSRISITNNTNNNERIGITKCQKCYKNIKVSSNYKGKKSPLCYNCRPWNCKNCTFENNSDLTSCEMCGELK